jgi:hypothetical protein
MAPIPLEFEVSEFHFMPDGEQLFLSSAAGPTVVVGLINGRILHEFPLVPETPNNFVISPDGNHLAFRTKRGVVAIWDLSGAARKARRGIQTARSERASRPPDAPSLGQLGNDYATIGIDDWAVASFEQAARAGPWTPTASEAIARHRLGRDDEALAIFRRLRDAARDSADRSYYQLWVDRLMERASD